MRFVSNLAACLLSFLLIAVFAACDGSSERSQKIGRLDVVFGAEQCTVPGAEFERDVRVEVRGVADDDSSGSGKQRLLAGEPVKFEAAEGSDLEITQLSEETDVVGVVRAKVKAGHKVGDNYIKIIPLNDPDKFVLVRMTVGAKIENAERQGMTNAVLVDPLVIKVVDADGNPVENAPVYFSVKSAPRSKSQPKVLTPEVRTDKNGLAQSFVRLGGETGEYHFAIEVADPAHNIYIRALDARLLGIDMFSVSMSMIGGIAFLIFGVLRLSRGLQNIAGEKMQQVLQFFSKNAFMGVIAGAFVTAVIQSSSATTIMVLGFINAGLLNLVQAIGIIFGANIGTTVTAQLISFNLSGISLPAITLGLILTFSKKRNIRGWGNAIFGFGMLFFGMNMMSTQMSILGTFPSFLHLFSLIDCAPKTPDGFMPLLPILGAIGIGMVAVFIVHASSAVIGIILALSAAGLVNFYTAVPLLIGTNIGTTVNAWLVSLTANRVAKQAALAHFLFNFFGAVLMVVLLYIPVGAQKTPFFLYIVNAITPGDAFAAVPQNLERHIAMAHTIFNVLTVLAIMPMLKPFAHLCETLIPGDRTKPVSTRTLEPLLLRTPAMAIEQSIIEIRRMVELSWSMIDRAVNHHFRAAHVDEKEFEQLEADEQQVDKMQSDITSYLVQITRQHLSNPQSNLIPLLMHCTNDAERIADHTANIMRLTKRLSKVDTKLSDVAQDNINSLWELLSSQAENVKLALSHKKEENEAGIRSALEGEKKLNKLAHKYEKNIKAMMAEQAREQQQEAAHVASDAEANEREINELAKQYEQVHVERRNKGQCAVDASVIFIEMLWELERIGDHLVNIAQRAPEMQKFYINI
ncbi:MAG: Na/Pi symporter [Lentisphaeria bacterium]|nr:Na/Pi symporter [Lentisphaeria bacterium]